MKAYPLIYSRTKYYDFVPDFLVRPKDLNCQLALRYIKNVMSDLDVIEDVRYTAFKVDTYCICGGIACASSKLVEKLKETSSVFSLKYTDVSDFLRDCKGRTVACFIGVAIPESEIRKDMIPDISLEKYWNIYFEYLKHQWLSETETHSEMIDIPLIEISEKKYISSFKPDIEMFGGHGAVKKDELHEQQIVDYFFNAIFNGKDESVITEIDRRTAWDDLNFKNAVVSEQLYSALKANPSGTSSVKSSLLNGSTVKPQNSNEVSIKRTVTLQNPNEVNIRRTEPSHERESAQKKKAHPFSKDYSKTSLFPIIAAVVVLVIIIFIVKALRN